ncbi:flavodoxin family protein [Clostridium sp. DL1XJH146]
MILGISASGRKDGITSKAVKEILSSTGLECEYISLSGKRINGCIGCTGCVKDNRCKVKDDWNEIGEKMLKADGIVFGAPNYYNTINALGHAALERTFCFRHKEKFDLAGKLGIVVSTGYNKLQNPAEDIIEKIMISNKMAVISKVKAAGYSQCYDCGDGLNCSVGNIVNDHGFIDEIKEEHLPIIFECQTEAKHEAYKAGKILGSIIRNRYNK